jgi:predicted RNase H-like HicB family nuclease
MNDDIKYEMVIYWSEEDDAYIVEVPELPGCMADGSTYEDAIKNTLAVIREWIDTAKELGREIPKPKGRLIYDNKVEYTILIYQAEEGGFWAEVPALPNCYSQGETIEETIENTKETIEAHLLPDEPFK